MSLAPKTRQQDRGRALRALLAELSEQSVEVYLDTADSAFADLKPTTWRDLERDELIEIERGIRPDNHFNVRLTGTGWREAVRAAGLLKDQTFLQRIGALSAYLKAEVAGRADDALVNADATPDSFSADFLYNVIESNALQFLFGRVGARWARDPNGNPHRKLIVVPPDFGLRIEAPSCGGDTNESRVIPFELPPPDSATPQVVAYFRALLREYRKQGVTLAHEHRDVVAADASTLAKIAEHREALKSGDEMHRRTAELIDLIIVMLGQSAETALPLAVLCRLMITPETMEDEGARLVREAKLEAEQDS